jgi:hypothetical protein
MPRNSSGAYSLVAGNPVITGTVIQSDWANTTMPDIGNELSDSLSRSGKGGMNAQLKFIQGSAPTPAMSFGAFPQSGMYAADGNDIRMSVAGVDRFRWLAANALPQTWDSVGGVWLDVGGGGVIWSEVDVLPNPVMISNGYSTLGGQTAVLPDNPPSGFSVAFADKADNWSSSNFLTLDGNGNTFTQDGSATYELDLKGAFAQFSFIDGQWQIVNFGRLSDYYGVDTDTFGSKPNLLINGDKLINQENFAGGQPAANVYGWDMWKGDALGTRIEQVVENTETLSGVYTISWAGGTGTADVDGQTGLNSGDSVVMTATGNYSVIVPTDATKIKFEKGSVASPYEPRLIGEELALCKRYYRKSYNYGVAPATNTTDGLLSMSSRAGDADTLIVETVQFGYGMRTPPAVTVYAQNGDIGRFHYTLQGPIVGYIENPLVAFQSNESVAIGGDGSTTTLTVGAQYIMRFHYVADARIY